MVKLGAMTALRIALPVATTNHLDNWLLKQPKKDSQLTTRTASVTSHAPPTLTTCLPTNSAISVEMVALHAPM